MRRLLLFRLLRRKFHCYRFKDRLVLSLGAPIPADRGAYSSEKVWDPDGRMSPEQASLYLECCWRDRGTRVVFVDYGSPHTQIIIVKVLDRLVL